MKMLVPTLALGLLLAACSGGNSNEDRILVLPTGAIAEAEFRLQARASLINAPLGSSRLCDGIAALNAEEAAKLLIMLESPGVDPGTSYVGTVTIDQERAATIIKEECARIR
jgi:hypothetical protein